MRIIPLNNTHFAKVNMPVIGVATSDCDALFVTPMVKDKRLQQPDRESIESKPYCSTYSAFSYSAHFPPSNELSAEIFPNKFDL